jgi:hypothetical protein
MTFNVTGTSTNVPAMRSFNTTGNSTDARPVSPIPGGGTGPAQLTRQKRRELERKKIQEMKKSSTPTRRKLTHAEIVNRIKNEQKQRVREEQRNEKRIAPSDRVDTTITDGEHGVLAIQMMATKTDSRDYLKYDDLLVLTSGHFKVWSGDMNLGQSTEDRFVIIGANRWSNAVEGLLRESARENDILLTDRLDDLDACFVGSLQNRCLQARGQAIWDTVFAIAPELAGSGRTIYVVEDIFDAQVLGSHLRSFNRGQSFHFELLPDAQ